MKGRREGEGRRERRTSEERGDESERRGGGRVFQHHGTGGPGNSGANGATVPRRFRGSTEYLCHTRAISVGT